MLVRPTFPSLPALLAAMAFTTIALVQSGMSQGLEYNRDVRPILAEFCFACHGFDHVKREAGLRLDTRDGALAELDSGETAIVPEHPEKSELMRRIETEDESISMPPSESGKHLNESQKKILKQWITEGAKYEKHWAFIPPVQGKLPDVEGESNLVPIDRFVRARLKQLGLTPSPEAEATTLVRRVYLDLIGLPPTPEQVDAYLQDRSKNEQTAYENLVESLLKSPHYGERWGRWWLDQARYADSNGYSIDAPRQIWKYRDWVVEALNQDMPFDEFTVQQLAGDLIPNATDAHRVATGFHRNTQINQEGGIDPEQFRIDSVFDRVGTTGSVWLGLTIGCAQCHNHKFDPIEQKEYYQLFAFFNNQEEPTMKVYPKDWDIAGMQKQHKEFDQSLRNHLKDHGEKMVEWEKSLDEGAKKKLPKDIQKILGTDPNKRNPNQRRALYSVFSQGKDADFEKIYEDWKVLDKKLDEVPTTMVLKERTEPRVTTVYIQGDFTRPSDKVNPATPQVLHPFQPQSASPNRLDFAKWLVDRANPLTARVTVNRVWQHYFGKGLVETENDFGLQGAAPSHPELLDWMAVEFMESGWSLKGLHRRIVLSKTYRQSSWNRPDLMEKDPNNDWLARQKRLRLEAEIVRDVGLTVSGLLSTKMGGAPVYPPIPEGVMTQGQVKRDWVVSKGEDRYRRGLYTFIYRATPPPSLNVFDAPDGFSACTRRIRSNTPLQALTLMNDSAYFEFAQSLRKIIDSQGLEAAFRRCTARYPSEDELRVLRSLDSLGAARAMLNLDETVTRE